MDQVPACFIESVLKNFGYGNRHEMKELSGLWGRTGNLYFKRGGSFCLSLVFDDRKEWSLYYRIDGFDHIKTRTLSRELVREMSKTITSTSLHVSHKRLNTTWERINHKDAIVPLLLRLDAPDRILSILEDKDIFTVLLSKYTEMLVKNSQFLGNFTSISLTSFDDPHAIRLVEGLVSIERLRSLLFWTTMPVVLPSSLWNSFFLSKSFRRLTAPFRLDVVLGVVRQWKQMDPHTLMHSKVVRGFTASSNEFTDVVMTPVPMTSLNTKVLKKIEYEVARSSINSLFRIDHPADPSRSLYVAFEECNCFLFFE
uniref:F-box domain-containing protein n=1 Tax=Steinernema glaseri TaxID=37863 RepID=A0A1I8AG48_9BILA